MFPARYFPPRFFAGRFFAQAGAAPVAPPAPPFNGQIARFLAIGGVKTVAAQRVYLKARWQDAWELQQHLYADQVSWAMAPSMSTASLRWRYGYGAQFGQQTFAAIAKRSGPLRLWVKIEYDASREGLDGGRLAAGVLRWVGSVELVPDLRGGVMTRGGVSIASGVQQLDCLGLEMALNRQPLDHSAYYISSAQGYLANKRSRRGVIPRVLPFNARNELHQAVGNRGPQLNGYHLFAGDAPPVAAQTWSTREIVRYLLAEHAPKDRDGKAWFPIALENEQLLPDNDAPTLDFTGKTLWEALAHAVPRSRFVAWRIAAEENAQGQTTVVLRCHSLAGDPIRFGSDTLPANPRRWWLKIDADPEVHSAATLKSSAVQAVDQFVCRGAQRTATGSFGYADSTLEKAWSSADETEYEAAASGVAGYAGWPRDEQQRRNAEARAVDKLRSVWRHFRIPTNWDGKVGDGEGGATKPLAFRDDDLLAPFLLCPRTLTILPQVLLLTGKDYTQIGTYSLRREPPDLGGGVQKRTRPLCFVRTPQVSGGADRRWLLIDQLGRGAGSANYQQEEVTHRWSGRVELAQHDESFGARTLEVDIVGEPQHVWAATEFSRLAVDEPLGDWNWREAIFTLTLADDRYAEAVWPPTQSVPVTRDHVRRIVVDCGDSYRLDWLAAGTVLRTTAAGALVKTTVGAWISDDRKKLLAKAQQLFAYYGRDRQALTFTTRKLTRELQLGDYLVQIGNDVAAVEPLGSIITQITIHSPASAAVPTITFDSAFLELEAVR